MNTTESELLGRLVTTFALGTLLLAIPTGGPAYAGELKGRASLGYGYLTHPIGLSSEKEAGYFSENLWLGLGFRPGANVLQVGYEGSASQFGNDTNLGSIRHGLGVEWFRNSPDRHHGLSAGVQWASRSYEDWYRIYGYQEGYGYFSFKRFIGVRTQLRGYAAMRIRIYEDLPEESSLEPHGQLELRHYSEGRTTLGAKVRFGVKKFNDVAASQVWETLNLPSTSQLAARLNFAQGLSNRVSLRAWFESRWNFGDYPHYVADDVFDSPILDRYAHDGWDAWAYLKMLAPWQVWLEMGAGGGEHDYGSLLFAGGESGLIRDDTVLEFTVSLTRRLGAGLGKPDLRLAGGYRNQDSTLSGYTYTGAYCSSSLSWRF